MALTLTANAGSAASTDKYDEFEAGVYDCEILSLKVTESQKYSNKDGSPKLQIEIECALPDVADDEGKVATSRIWPNAVLLPPNPDATTENGKKGSHLWRIVKAVTGHEVGLDEEYDLDQLKGKRFRAFCDLSDKGYPRIKNDTIVPQRGMKAKAAPPTAPAVAPTRPGPPQRPQPPAVQAGPPTLTPNQMQEVRDFFVAQGWGGEDAITTWTTTNYEGRGLAQIRRDEFDRMREELGMPIPVGEDPVPF